MFVYETAAPLVDQRSLLALIDRREVLAADMACCGRWAEEDEDGGYETIGPYLKLQRLRGHQAGAAAAMSD